MDNLTLLIASLIALPIVSLVVAWTRITNKELGKLDSLEDDLE